MKYNNNMVRDICTVPAEQTRYDVHGITTQQNKQTIFTVKHKYNSKILMTFIFELSGRGLKIAVRGGAPLHCINAHVITAE